MGIMVIIVMVIIILVIIVMVIMGMVIMVTQLSMFDSLLPVGSMTKMMGIRRSAAHQDSGRVTMRI